MSIKSLKIVDNSSIKALNGGHMYILLQQEEDSALAMETKHQASPIHSDPLNFAQYYKEKHHYAGIQHVFAGSTPEIDDQKRTITLMIGISGSGKDDSLITCQQYGLPWVQILTGTSRSRRYKFIETENELPIEYMQKEAIVQAIENAETREIRDKLLDYYAGLGILEVDPIDSYVWMRPKRNDETEEQYGANLKAEYDLVEYDYHHLTHYGLPRKNIENALGIEGALPIIRTEINGAITLTRVLRELGYNTLTIAIMPDSLEQADEAIKQREKPDKIAKRMQDNREHLARFPQIANFYIRNTRETTHVDGAPIDGRRQTFAAIQALYQLLGLQ